MSRASTQIQEKSEDLTITGLKVTGLLPGSPPRITAEKVSNGLHGSKPIAISYRVPNENLWEQLLSKVNVGDSVDLTIRTSWFKKGNLSVVVDFRTYNQ